jgi:hypothetical protein
MKKRGSDTIVYGSKIENEKRNGGRQMATEVVLQQSHLILDKDNDLRCRINKRAQIIFGSNNSPEKQAYIDVEFAKRQSKRQGKETSLEQDANDHMYAAILNNPEFASILMSLLAQHGVSPTESDTPTILLNILKNNPDFLPQFLATATAPPESQPVKTEPTEVQQDVFPVDVEGGVEGGQLIMSSQGVPFENPPMDQHTYASSPIQVHASTLRPAPIPPLGVKAEVQSVLAPPQPSVPLPSTINSPIPSATALLPPTTSSSNVQQASVDRVRVFGFPPMMSRPR